MKLGAAALPADDVEAQLLLLTAAKDVAISLRDLIDATRMASGKNVQDPSMEKLKGSAKVGVACSETGCGWVWFVPRQAVGGCGLLGGVGIYNVHV